VISFDEVDVTPSFGKLTPENARQIGIKHRSGGLFEELSK
jgi:hypothetical protein